MPNRDQRVWSSIGFAAALAATAFLFGSPALAQDDAGKELFTKYCGACHGPGGTGDGILANILKDKPKDLTMIAKNNGGDFPANKVMTFIDGTKDVRAHGDPDMPVWGEVFRENLADSPAQQAEIRGIIMLITNYVGSIQQK